MLNTLRKDIDKSIKAFLKDVKRDYKLHLSSKTLFDGIKDFLLREGKRIRPILFAISYMGYTKRKKYSHASLFRSAIALELLHDFMLIHDDVIDKSELRRGKPTLHRVFNKKMGMAKDNELGPGLSIVAGDVIFALAIEAFLSFDGDLLLKENALRKLTETASYTCIGEFMDVVNGVRKLDEFKEKDVFINYTYKTAKYTFECPLLIGAILAGRDKKEMKKLSRLGLLLGQAFQIQDDYLDMFSSTAEIGKSVLSDINESKKTLLVWKAYDGLETKERKEFKKLLEKDRKTYQDLIKIRKLIKYSGADKYCLDKTVFLLEEARGIYPELNMKRKYLLVLQDLINKVFTRTDSLRNTLHENKRS